MEKHPFTNRLIHEKSPHLLQHAHNPVDWYPWGKEAFELAKIEDKPIFLSIGYATCYWCHAMERECFSDTNMAGLMNDAFVCVKVDREELPEVDALYMDFAQTMITGVLGWPLNLMLTPDLKPFFAITYISSQGISGSATFRQMLYHLRSVWESDERESVQEKAERVVEAFEASFHDYGEELPDELHIINTAELLFRLVDPTYGGIKGIPKFPVACQIYFMLRYVHDSRDGRALFYVERTLEMMSRGGIHDLLGGGYCRYATDEKWQIPHFEKTLYDNVLMARAQLETWHISKKEPFREMCEKTLSYVLSSLKNEEGGFFCAEDADFEGEEGRYYTWCYDDILRVLGKMDSALFSEFYDISIEGNFFGRNILHSQNSIEEFAELKGIDIDELTLHLKTQRGLLLEERQKLAKPFKDTKILSSWNGLAIYTFAKASCVLQNDKYLKEAQRAAWFVKTHLWKEGRLLHCWCDGEAKISSTIDDYAFMIHGLLSLFEVDGDAGWLAWSMQMVKILEEEFKSQEGAFHTTDGMSQSLLIKRCEFIDGSLPSGNAVHCENLLRLYLITKDERYLIQAEDILRALKGFVDGFNPSYGYHLTALQFYLSSKAADIVIALNEDEDYKTEIHCVLAECFFPYKTIIWRREDDEHLFELLPFVRRQKSINQKTTVYICQSGSCVYPLTELSEIIKAIKKALA